MANAEAYAKRSAPDPSQEPAQKQRRLLANVAALLSGAGSGSALQGSALGDADDFENSDPLGVFGTGNQGLPSTAQLSQSKPGELMHEALEAIKKRLAVVHGDAAVDNQSRRILSFYHEIFFRPQVGEGLKPSVDREMATLAAIADSLQEGNLGRAGDIVYARYKALEEGVTHGDWEMAAELEAVPTRDSTLTSEGERHRIAMRQLRRVRLATAVESLARRQGQGAG